MTRTFFHGVEPLQALVDKDGQQRYQDHALSRPEIAAVDARREDGHVQQLAPVPEAPGRLARRGEPA